MAFNSLLLEIGTCIPQKNVHLLCQKLFSVTFNVTFNFLIKTVTFNFERHSYPVLDGDSRSITNWTFVVSICLSIFIYNHDRNAQSTKNVKSTKR